MLSLQNYIISLACLPYPLTEPPCRIDTLMAHDYGDDACIRIDVLQERYLDLHRMLEPMCVRTVGYGLCQLGSYLLMDLAFSLQGERQERKL